MNPNNYQKTHPNYQEIEVSEYISGILKLISPNLKFAPESLKWVSDKEAVKMIGGDFSKVSLKGEEERIKDILEDKDAYHWFIEFNNRIIGNVNLHHIEETSKKFSVKAARITYLIGDKSLWGKGLGTAVAKAVINWAFNKGEFQVITARAVPQNTGSIKVLERLGFVPNGTEPYDGPDFGEPTIWNQYKLEKLA